MKILIVIFLFVSVFCKAQGVQTKILVPVNGGQDSALLYLPDDYFTAFKAYPLLLFAHGSGEAADGGSVGNGLAKIANQTTAGGPANLIATGKWPSAILNLKDGNLYKFIVVSPQAKSGGLNGDDIDLILSYLVKNYRIDISREYIMGISLGGGGAMEFASHLDPNESVTTHTRKNIIAAEIILSGATITPVKSWATGVLADSIHIAAFADPNNDTYGENDMNYVGFINGTRLGFALFVPNNYGHGGWSNIYLPSFLIPSLNINVYQWLLQWQAKGSGPIVPIASLIAHPVLDSSAVHYPNTIVHVRDTINNSGSWGQASGPTIALFSSIPGNAVAISGLFPGTYQFEERVFDALGPGGAMRQDSAFFIVQVNGPPSCPPVVICPVCSPPIVCPPPRNVTGLQININGVMISIPVTGCKFNYSDGNP